MEDIENQSNDQSYINTTNNEEITQDHEIQQLLQEY